MRHERIRTLIEAVDLRDFRRITAEELLIGGLDFCQQVRRQATLARDSGQPIVCAKCGWPVYLTKNGLTKEYLWAHFADAPHSYAWFTGKGRSVDHVSALQFQGAQESPLHQRLKNLIAELLEGDSQAGDDLEIDTYLIGQTEKRKPDVRVTYSGRPMAFEIQLANTQLPIIIAREQFYVEEGRDLIWVTWKPDIARKADLPQAFLDIVTSHNGNLFSIDEEAIGVSQSSKTFTLRVHWWEGSLVQTKLVTLDALAYPEGRLPYAIAPPPLWHDRFKDRWIAHGRTGRIPWQEKKHLYSELISALDLPMTDTELNLESEIDAMLSLFLSLERNEVIGSLQKNLTEVVHTFLKTADRMPLARMAEHAICKSGHGSLLSRSKTQELLHRAKCVTQKGKGSVEAQIAKALFPDWAGPADLSKASRSAPGRS